MKKIFLLLSAFIIASCSSDDSEPTQSNKKLYVTKITNISSRSTTELNFTYDSKNRLTKNETETYYREFIYDANDRIKQIKSITKPNTLYYTVNFIYDSSGKVVEVKRDNHHNGTIFYVKYDYFNTGEVNNVYVFDKQESYNNNKHDRYYAISGYSIGNNFTAKTLSVYDITFNMYDLDNTETWSYDLNNRPYFGEAIKNISLPYATDGTGMDWDIMYQTNNPIKFSFFDFNSGKDFVRRTFEYEYNSDDRPTKIVKKTYNSDGSLNSTFTQNLTYSLR
ncbi:hypothetical protein [Tenacibaculum crassostreae]|uniref:hypothetical protein n=1 Tax=Tenacibaculum crassostreae TaxID=502683 RepID=UPI0038940065